MNIHTDKKQNNKSQSVANETSQRPNGHDSSFKIVDNRPEAIAQRKLHEMAGNSRRASKLVQMKTLSDNYSVCQLQVIQKGGSHGKKKKLNVQGTYTDGGAPVNFNDRGQNISIVKGHDGYTDQDALAEAWVKAAYRLSANAVVTITNYNFYTAK